ncbi:MAG: hypothetical protein IJJ25_00670 [Lachnospiraceae bacterium]|nr:hypothetical protein [Lachnospiraceae bacterium]
MERGTYGYIKHRQSFLFKMTLACAAAVALLATIGFIIWRTRFNLLMIPSMLCVLPLANYLASYAAMAKYHTPSEELFAAVKAYDDAGMLMSDMIVVDEKGRRAGLDLAVIYKNGIVGYQGNEKESRDRVEITINDTLKSRGIPMRIKVFRNFNEFTARLSDVPAVIEEADARKISLAKDAVKGVIM